MEFHFVSLPSVEAQCTLRMIIDQPDASTLNSSILVTRFRHAVLWSRTHGRVLVSVSCHPHRVESPHSIGGSQDLRFRMRNGSALDHNMNLIKILGSIDWDKE